MAQTLQEHYNLIKSGKGNKTQFLRQAREMFPQYFNQYSDFDTTTNVLRSKQIISETTTNVVTKGFDIYDWKKILAEEVKAEEKETSKEVKDANKNAYQPSDMKNADNVNFNEIMKGFYAELKDPKNHDKTSEEIKAMVVKNLAKDCLHYTKDGMFGEKGVGYVTEVPGLGTPKEAKGKHKSSGYGDIEKEVKVKANVQDSLGDKEAETSMPKKVKEMSVTPQNSAGVKKMKMPGTEKTMKLQEGIHDRDITSASHTNVRQLPGGFWDNIKYEDASKLFDYHERTGDLPAGLSSEGYDKIMKKFNISRMDDSDIPFKNMTENADVYQQLEDLQNELMFEKDPERKAEIEKKILALSQVKESKLRSLLKSMIKETLK